LETKVLKMKISDYLGTVLDENCLPDNQFIKSRDWKCIVIPGEPNMMEIEWLSNSINDAGLAKLINIYFEYQKIRVEYNITKSSIDDILKALRSNLEKYSLITNESSDFICFRHQSGDFYMICGPEKFVVSSYKCSVKTAKFMFDEYIKEFKIDEKRKLQDVWGRYMNL